MFFVCSVGRFGLARKPFVSIVFVVVFIMFVGCGFQLVVLFWSGNLSSPVCFVDCFMCFVVFPCCVLFLLAGRFGLTRKPFVYCLCVCVVSLCCLFIQLVVWLCCLSIVCV